jgi:hypothetical protein
MHKIAQELPDHEHAFSPFFCDGLLERLRRRGLLEFTIAGEKLRRRCLDYLERNKLRLDERGLRGRYDLVVTCSDLIVPRGLTGRPVVLVQEGILDPVGWPYHLWRRFPFLPRWIGGTAATGTSLAYERFCVASEGYRDHFIGQGMPPKKIVVTGIPNFDDCRRYLRNVFPHRNYVLVCTSDGRETFKRDDRWEFLHRCVRIAGARSIIFKLHPNEDIARATAEIRRVVGDALIFAEGRAEEMIANCDELITEWSSTVFVGLALGKKCHSNFDLAELTRLLPVQNACAARNIGQVCRQVLAEQAALDSPPTRLSGLALSEAP